ncbi:MAG: sensor histidine kinase [Velocimicrobium sp.]
MSVKNGAINLLEVKTQKTGVIELNGAWEFYFGKLLSPDDFDENEEVPSLMMVPGSWGQDMSGKSYPDHGCATYHLTINHVIPNTFYGIKKQSIRVACKIFVDGKLVYTDGTPSDSIKNEVMGNDPGILFFESNSDTLDVIIQLSSHKYAQGGIGDPILFGVQKDIVLMNNTNLFYEVARIAFMIGIGVIYAMMVLFIPAYRKQEPASVVFPLVVILFALLNATLGERILKLLIPWISSEGLLRVETAIICLYISSLVVLVHKMEEKIISKRYCKVVFYMQGILLLTDFVYPAYAYTLWKGVCALNFFILLILALRLFYFYWKETTLGINTIEHTFLLLVLYAVNVYDLDIIMFTMGKIGNKSLAIFSSMFYILFWVFLMIYRYHEIFQKNETLTVALLESSYNMEKTSTSAMRSEVAFLQAQIKPHFLFNSLSSIMSLQRTNPQKAYELLKHLSEFLKHSFYVDSSKDYIVLESELEIIQSYVFIEKARFGDRIQVDFFIEEALKKQKLIPLLIQPLVENAIRHGALEREEGGYVSLSIYIKEEYTIISVYDNGPGFSRVSRERLQEEIKEDKKIGKKGVGIRNIKERLAHYYQEELHIEEDNKGVTVWFQIPLYKEE